MKSIPRSDLKWKHKKSELYSKRVIFIPGSVPSSKNSRRIVKGGTIASKAVYKYRKESKQFWEKYKSEFIKLLQGRTPPYEIGFYFVKKTSHKFDWINPCQTVQDEMVKYDWIEDDNIEVMVPFPFKIDGEYFHFDSKNPGVYIYVP